MSGTHKVPGSIAERPQKSRKHCATHAKFQPPPTPYGKGLFFRGVKKYCAGLVKFRGVKKPPRERLVNLGGFSLWGLPDYCL